MEEMTRRPDFICDPVPGNFRQRFEGRKGKNRSLTVLIVVLFFLQSVCLTPYFLRRVRMGIGMQLSEGAGDMRF